VDWGIVVETGIIRNNDTQTGMRVRFDSIVRDNAIFGNAASGIAVNEGNIISGNTASSNDGAGMFVGPYSTVSDNVARGNPGGGIKVDCPSAVYDNTALSNGLLLEARGASNFSFTGDNCVNVFNIGDNSELRAPE
jgi:parallel beta-helix repeat protein